MNKVIVLLGPTGVGKTGVSILLAKQLNTEIISADSMQIYKHMDIGTAKPTPKEMTMVRHHMVDIIEPYEPYSTGKYITTVVPVIEELHKQGKTPVVVGGTGLYIRAMTRGIFSGPSADWSLREELHSLEKEEKGFLYNLLKELDPEASNKITQNDMRRIIRSLEVCMKIKGSISEMHKKLTKPLPYNFIKIGISRDRKELYRLIENRVDIMINEGLVDEVKNLMQTIKNSEALNQFTNLPLPSMQAIGYKEIMMYLNSEITLDEAIRLIKRGTKRFAKRQFTWFRKEEGIHWVDITGMHDIKEIFIRVYDILKSLL